MAIDSDEAGTPPTMTDAAATAPTAAGGDARGPRAGGRRRPMLARGESLIAAMAVAALVIMVATLAAVAWWAVGSHRRQAERARHEEVRAVAAYLAKGAEVMLASGDLSGLRRTLLEAARDARLIECRVVLPDGRVVADAVPSRINVAALPERWAAGPVDGSGTPPQAGQVALSRPLSVPGRGAAIVEVTAALDRGATAEADAWDVHATIGLIGACGLGLLLLVYRQLRSKVRTMGMIREALLAMARGEQARDALMLAGASGPEAEAWNALLTESERRGRQELAARAAAALGREPELKGELERACDALAMGLVILDEAGTVRHANGAAAALLEFDRTTAGGRRLAELAGDEALRAALSEAVRPTAGAGAAAGAGGATSAPAPEAGLQQRRSFEVARGEGDGRSVLRLSVRPLRRSDGSGSLLTVEDVTQQKVAEAARGTFVTQATHELRTPLTNMRLCLEAALDASGGGTAGAGGAARQDPAAIEQCFNLMSHEVRRLERTVTEMLSVSEIEAGALRLRSDDVRLEAALAEMRADFEPQAKEKGIVLAFDLPPKLPVIEGDRDKLVLALHNLVGNAIKYTPSGGRVTVSVRASAEQVAVDVRDTGIGIRPEEQERVFERFYRAKDERVSKVTGSGLGLALAREVARLHGGDVTVHSEIDRGSTFTLTVPAVPAAAAAERAGTARAA